jgi:exopolyphosphatase / guanosine-5'-triphosphate,3'-diphosphate pyrophosphatase
MTEYSTIAAVDLGSNSFRLQVSRVVGGQIYPLDSLKETVRLAGGLGADKYLDDASQETALNCLKRFAERLRGLPPEAVRVVGTNTLRVAKNAAQFIKRAEAALGFPIEIVAGHEEARLIYVGVAHSLPASPDKRLVVDIGGGSTELIIGSGFEPLQMESLYMGCVSFSRRFFPEGKITQKNLRAAELAAGAELQTIAAGFSAGHWAEAIGSSGTARALGDILEQNGYSESGITPAGLARLRAVLLKAGDYRRLGLPGLREERAPVLAGGFAIMSSIVNELAIVRMAASDSGLRDGVAYDMLGRFQHQDARETTVEQFMDRYHVDRAQAARVEALSRMLYRQLLASSFAADREGQCLAWAARLHEIGISIAYSGFHKHSAYIIENADMPGFSRQEQTRLGLLLAGQRGSLTKIEGRVSAEQGWQPILALRLAALFYRGRNDTPLPAMRLAVAGRDIVLTISRGWMEGNPLTEAALQNEKQAWQMIGFNLTLQWAESEGRQAGRAGLPV